MGLWIFAFRGQIPFGRSEASFCSFGAFDGHSLRASRGLRDIGARGRPGLAARTDPHPIWVAFFIHERPTIPPDRRHFFSRVVTVIGAAGTRRRRCLSRQTSSLEICQRNQRIFPLGRITATISFIWSNSGQFKVAWEEKVMR